MNNLCTLFPKSDETLSLKTGFELVINKNAFMDFYDAECILKNEDIVENIGALNISNNNLLSTYVFESLSQDVIEGNQWV
jgi:hypothetical protein